MDLPIGLTTITKGAPLLIAASMEFVGVAEEMVLLKEVACMETGLDVDRVGDEDGGREGCDIDEYVDDRAALRTELEAALVGYESVVVKLQR